MKWLTFTCSECIRENHYTYYEKHREQALATIKNWSTNNLDKGKETSKRYRENNDGADSRNRKKWYSGNKEHTSKYGRWWRSVNKARNQQYNANRRAQVKQAMPTWADINKIIEIYKQSVDISNTTGIIHHVDHIIPLVNDLVCGLHVHDNLQILTSTDNMSKGNKFIIE